MRVRPLLLERHRGQAERALANVDLYLSLSTGYAVRGLRAFAEAMTAAWSDEARAVEGRPDAQEEAVALFTMHAAKGLEWPIVIPVNTMTGVMAPEAPSSTARPRPSIARSWASCPRATKPRARRKRRSWTANASGSGMSRPPAPANSRLAPARRHAVEIGLDRSRRSVARRPSRPGRLSLPAGLTAAGAGAGNTQTRASFAAEAEAIAAAQTRLTWLAPSRDENAAGTVLREEEAALWTGSADDQPPSWKPPSSCRVAASAG
jgi:exodeoxyribonuclease-5